MYTLLVMSIDFSICKEKILEFHSSISSTQALDAELKFNKCVSDMIEDDFLVFFLSTWRSPDVGHVRALGNTPLKHEIFFEIDSKELKETVRGGEKQILSTDELGGKLLDRISAIVEAKPKDFFCVPFLPEDPKLPRILYCMLPPADKCGCMKKTYIIAVKYMLRHCGNTLSLFFLNDEQVRLYRRSRDLLDVAQRLFQNLGNVKGVLSVVMHEARKLVKAERCSIFLVDKQHGTLNAKVFDGAGDKDVKLPIDQGIAGHVVVTGQVMNVRDPYKDPSFYRGIDEGSGFITRNILCVPIHNKGEVIAVAQLCNKIDFPHFTRYDEEICGPFASYCGICIEHSMLYDKMLIAKARQKITNELMIFNMKQKVHLYEKVELIKCDFDHRAAYHYDSFSCSPLVVSDKHTICVVLEMFEDLELMKEFDIHRDTMARCIICMKAGYRDPPYHNWMHAFSVVHFGYLMIRGFHLIEEGYMNKLEALSFLVACIGHDIDHRGTTNSFQSKTGTELASLYSSQGSVMERHHFQQTMCVLHLEDCNIFEHIDKDQYLFCVEIINHVILATDLANHLKSEKAQEQAFHAFDKDNPRHRDLLYAAMVTCADFGMQTKDFHSVRLTVKSLYEEFFRQGDLEVAIGVSPSGMMDRRSARIPEQQVEFLECIVVPIFELLRPLFEATAARLVDAVRSAQHCWRQAVPVFDRLLERGVEALHIIGDSAFEAEVLDLVKRQADAGGESPSYQASAEQKKP